MKWMHAIIMTVLLGGTGAFSLHAAGVEALSKQADTELRNAQRKMFNGQKSAADEHLLRASSLIESMASSGASDALVKAMQRKHDKLRKDLDKRMKTTVAKAPSAVAATSEKPAKLPYRARETLREFERRYKQADYARNHNDSETSDQAVEKLRTLLAQAKTEATGMENHPDIIAAQRKLDWLGAAAPVAQPQERKIAAAGMAGDIEKLDALYERLNRDYFTSLNGQPIYYNDLRPVYELLDVLEDYERKVRPEATAFAERFAKDYGETFETVERTTGSSNVAFRFQKLQKGLADIDRSRDVMAEDLIAKVEQIHLRVLPRMHDFKRIEQHQTIRDWVDAAAKFSPSNPKVAAMNVKLDTLLAEDMKLARQHIASKAWPGHANSAPSNANELAKAAKRWFENDPEWGPRYDILAVGVRGPWSVQKRNILGETVMYGLPVVVAVQRKADAKHNLARVFELTMRTYEKRGVAQEPPFEYPTVGGSYFMLADKVD